MSIHYVHEISVENYNELRKSVDWIEVAPRRANIALHNSYFLCVAMDEDRVVGMARLVSDGGYTCFITDVIVRPEYQGRHIGKQLINYILEYIEKDLAKGETVMVSLMSAHEKENFYKKFGFIQRPTKKRGSGMSMWVERDDMGEISINSQIK